MSFRLVATDLDGTLVRSDGSVSDRSHAVLKELSERGVHIVGATGRGPWLHDLTRSDVPSARFLVLGQGGFVFERNGDGAVVRHSESLLESDTAALVMRLLEAEVGPLHMAAEIYDSGAEQLRGDRLPDWPYPVSIVEMPRERALSGRVVKLILGCEHRSSHDLLELARRVVPEQLAEVTESGIGFLEVCPPGVNKGVGLALACRFLGVEMNQVVAFGDALNDLPMFDRVGHAVAMAGAHPAVKAAADEVAGGNDEDGVAEFLERAFANLLR